MVGPEPEKTCIDESGSSATSMGMPGVSNTTEIILYLTESRRIFSLSSLQDGIMSAFCFGYYCNIMSVIK